MLRVTREPSSRSFIQCLVKNTVMVLSCPLVLSREYLYKQCSTHTHHGQIYCHNTDYVHASGHDKTIIVFLAKHCIKLPDNGFLVIRSKLENFYIFYNNFNYIYELYICASVG